MQYRKRLQPGVHACDEILGITAEFKVEERMV